LVILARVKCLSLITLNGWFGLVRLSEEWMAPHESFGLVDGGIGGGGKDDEWMIDEVMF